MRVKIQNSTEARMFCTPTPFALRAAHLAGVNIKGSLDRRLGFFFFHVRLPSISLAFFLISFKFHPQSRRGVGVKCV